MTETLSLHQNRKKEKGEEGEHENGFHYRCTRTAFGVYNFVAMSSAIFAPYLTGYLSDKTGSMDAGFYLSAGLLLAGMVVLIFAKEKTRTA